MAGLSAALRERQKVECSSTLQSLIALSVGEAEYYAIVKGAAMGIAIRALLADYGIEMEVVIESDSTTAGSMCARLGVGHRTKHIQTRFLWVQERVQCGDVSIAKIGTDDTISDVATKPVGEKTLIRHCRASGLVFPR